MENCPICAEKLAGYNEVFGCDMHEITCYKCSSFSITHEQVLYLKHSSISDRQRANISGWLFENQGSKISSNEEVTTLEKLKRPTFIESANKLLIHISRQSEMIGFSIEVNEYWTSRAWCVDYSELDFILSYLIEIKLLLDQRKDAGFYSRRIKITPQGWQKIEELQKTNIDSQQGFIAMWFDEKMKPIYEDAIAPAISAAGYKPYRADQGEHNDKIDDEMIAQIRQSKFVVADFTGHRGGVYYEAGFAKGLGLEVFWLCNEKDKEDLHFDIRQYNCIVWDDKEPDKLKKRLKNRIESILGRGSYQQSL